MKKIALLVLILLTICSVAFAAPDKPQEATMFGTLEYFLNVKQVAVYNEGDGVWYRLNQTPQEFDVVYLNSGATQYWFANAANLPDGHYTKARVIFTPNIKYRSHVQNGSDEYWTTSGNSTNMIKGSQPEYASSGQVLYTLTDTDITNSKSLYSGIGNIDRAKVFNPDYPNNTDIRVDITNAPFNLKEGIPKSMIIQWDVRDSISGASFNATDCTTVLKIPKITVSVQ